MMIKAITIYLGSKCNLNCAYCHREADKEETGVTEKLLKLLADKKPQEVRFFGGEPTLYMDDIKKVVSACPWAQFTVTTNGVLLSQHIEYFREHDFKIILSYDGTNEKDSLRKYNPLKAVIEYPKLGVSTTLYHGNTDFKHILKNFCKMERNIKRPLRFFPHICHHTSKENEPFALTRQDVSDVLANYKYAIGKVWNDFERYGVINTRYATVFNQVMREYKAQYSFGETYCMDSERLKVNANGDAFNCLYVRNIPAKNNKQFMAKSFPACAKCEFYHMCGGACVQSISHNIECLFYYSLYSFFSDFIKKLPSDKLNRLRRIIQC